MRQPAAPVAEAVGARGNYEAIITSAIFSALMSTGKLVLALGTRGKIEASTTRRPLMPPRTRPCVSVTAMGSPSAPMRHEHEACHTPIVDLPTPIMPTSTIDRSLPSNVTDGVSGREAIAMGAIYRLILAGKPFAKWRIQEEKCKSGR